MPLTPRPFRLAPALAAALAASAALLPAARPLRAQALPDVETLLDHFDDLYRAHSSHAVMTMTVVKERGTRELTLESWSEGQDEALVVIRDPAREAGTATLLTDDGLWNYAPRADRLIRIPTGLLSDAWMGSHFTNDDLVRETKYRDDYDATASWAERGGERLIQVTMTPKPDAPVVYSQVLFFVRPDGLVPVREEYYDEGDLVRTMTLDQVKTVAGRKVPMHLRLVPADAPGEYTDLLYTTLELNVSVPDDLFTRRGLRRVARG